ncbi:hypothetical protein OIV83_000503 [Microbotryomycetes sp. JL201]|nr:hypothetical protein OIV83_000503 [Microbotryomycetes sp. JL201]
MGHTGDEARARPVERDQDAYVLGQHQLAHLAGHFKAFARDQRVVAQPPDALRLNDSALERRASTRRTAKRARQLEHYHGKRAQLDDDSIDAFDCLYLGQSTDQADKEEFEAYCATSNDEVVNDSGFKLRRDASHRASSDVVQQHKRAARSDRAHAGHRHGKRVRDASSSRDAHATGLLRLQEDGPARAPEQPTRTATQHRLLARQATSATATASSLDESQLASLEAGYASVRSVLSTRSLAGSAVPDALFSSVLNDINSAQAAIQSRQSAIESPTTSSTTAAPSSAASASNPTSSGSSPPSSTASSTLSTAGPGSTAEPSNNNPHRIRNIVVPAVVIPIGLLLLAVLLWLCLKRRSRDHDKTSVGDISHPMPAGAAVSGRQAAGQHSNESFATSPSAIGVAVSDPQPRTKWGRRSFIEAFAAGRAARNRGPAAEPQAVSTSTVQGAGRQPSVTNMSEIAAGGALAGGAAAGDRPYSPTTYRPGMQRPLMSPVSHHYDPFVQPPSIVPVPHRRSSSLSGASVASQSEYERSERGSTGNFGAVAGTAAATAAGAGTVAAVAGRRAGDEDNEVEEVRSDLPPPIPPIPADSDLPYQQHGGASTAASSASVIGGGRIRRMQTGDTTTSGEGQFYTASSGGSIDSTGSHASRHFNLGVAGTGAGHNGAGSIGGHSGGRPSGGSSSEGTDIPMSPQQAPVNFGSSGSSGAGSNNDHGSIGTHGTPRPESQSSMRSVGGTPRLGAGHGSMSGMRKGDGSWW